MAAPRESAWEISYVLGHDTHRFEAEAQDRRIQARTWLEAEVLQEGAIDLNSYETLLQRVSKLADEASSRTPAQSCRSPFSIRIRREGRTRAVSGCRTGPTGTHLSHILRDAELTLMRRTISAK
jgi:hypothetical protein